MITIHISFGMAAFLGILYGLHMVLVIYFINFFAARGAMRGVAFSIPLVLGKYLIYWGIVVFGFRHLPFWGILIGFTGGIYLSLPILYFVNKKLVDRSPERSLR